MRSFQSAEAMSLILSIATTKAGMRHFAQGPPYPPKRTWFSTAVVSALCQKATLEENQNFSNPSHPSKHAGRHDDGNWTDVGFPEEDRACCRDHVVDR
jgi:hypothetical protein